MHFCKTDFFDKSAAFLKVLFSFSGETDNYIGGNGAVGEKLPNILHYLAICVRIIAPAHCRKSAVASALKRKVKLRAKFRKLCKAFNILPL